VIRLAVRVRRADAEEVLAELLGMVPAGVEECDGGGETVEYAVYGSEGELPTLPDLKAAAGEALVEVATSEVADGWDERWKEFHKPVLIEPGTPAPGRRAAPALWVRPPWEAESERGDAAEIVIDPGRAFGTGAHATTRMCLELLMRAAREEDERKGPMVDVGTGSGVLAIAGAKLGYGPVEALDNDPESVEAATENAAVNGVMIEVRRWDLRREPIPMIDGDGGVTVTANLVKPLLEEIARTIEHAPTNLIAGGLLNGQVDEVAEAFAERLGMEERERRSGGEWSAVWLTGPPEGISHRGRHSRRQAVKRPASRPPFLQSAGPLFSQRPSGRTVTASAIAR
jgi:ribosomal protein L11 methyltransferase